MDGVCDYCGNMLTEWDYMTECGHIICGSVCYNRHESICPICKKQCKFVLIGEKMPPNATGFLRPAKNIFTDAENIMNFRLLALTRLIRFLRDKISKQKDILNQAKQELSQVKEYKWEIYHLKRENEYLKSELQHSKSPSVQQMDMKSELRHSESSGSRQLDPKSGYYYSRSTSSRHLD